MGERLVEGWDRAAIEATLRLRGIPNHRQRDYWPIISAVESDLRQMLREARKREKDKPADDGIKPIRSGTTLGSMMRQA